MTGLQDVTELMLATDPQNISADVYVYTYCTLVCYVSTVSVKDNAGNFVV